MAYYQTVESFRSVNNKKVGEIFVTADLIHAYLCSECVKKGSAAALGVSDNDNDDGCCFITSTSAQFWEHIQRNHNNVLQEVDIGIGDSLKKSALKEVIIIDDDDEDEDLFNEQQQEEQQQEQDISTVYEADEKQPEEFSTNLFQEGLSKKNKNFSYSLDCNKNVKLNNLKNNNGWDKNSNVGGETGSNDINIETIVIDEDEIQKDDSDNNNNATSNFQENIADPREYCSSADPTSTNPKAIANEMEDEENDEITKIKEYLQNYKDDCDIVLNSHMEKSKEDNSLSSVAKHHFLEYNPSRRSLSIDLSNNNQVNNNEQSGEVPTSTTLITDPPLTSTTTQINALSEEAQNDTRKNRNTSPHTRLPEQMQDNLEYPAYTPHRIQHQQIKGFPPFKCNQCEERFHEFWQKAQHENGHQTFFHARPYKCSICNRRTATENALSHHIRRFHGTIPQNPIVPISESKFQCLECKTTYKHKQSLSVHVARKHGQSSKSNAVDTASKAAASPLPSPNIRPSSNTSQPFLYSTNMGPTSNAPQHFSYSTNMGPASNAPQSFLYPTNMGPTSSGDAMMAWERSILMAREESTRMRQEHSSMMAQESPSMRAHCVWHLQSPYQPALDNTLESFGSFYADNRTREIDHLMKSLGEKL